MRRGLHVVVLGLLAGLLLAGLYLQMSSGSGNEHPASVLAEGPSGRSLLFETLQRLDVPVRAFDATPGQLPDGGVLLWLAKVPELPAGYGRLEGEANGTQRDGPTEPVLPSGARRGRDPLHYLRFVRAGGVLFMPGNTSMLEFLSDTLGLEELVPTERQETSYPLTCVLPDGESFVVDWEPAQVFPTPPPSSPLEVVLASDQGQVLGLRLPYGGGSFVLLASDDDLADNRNIVDEGNALLVVRLIEAHLPSRGEVWFDEYALGGWSPDSPLDLAFAAGNRSFSVHLLIGVLLFLWATGWVGAFPRDPVRWRPVSARMRAQGTAAWFERAGRYGLLANALRQDVLRRLEPRGRAKVTSRAASNGDGGVPEAPSDEAVRGALANRPHARGLSIVQSEALRGQALELLVNRRVSSRGELEQLSDELLEWERRLSGASRATSTPLSPSMPMPAEPASDA